MNQTKKQIQIKNTFPEVFFISPFNGKIYYFNKVLQ